MFSVRRRTFQNTVFQKMATKKTNKETKPIFEWSKKCCIGYCREQEKRLKLSTIPIPVSYLTALFVYDVYGECFDASAENCNIIDKKEKKYIIGDHNLITKKSNPHWIFNASCRGNKSCIIFGKTCIKSQGNMKHRWSIEVLGTRDNGSTPPAGISSYIGVSSYKGSTNKYKPGEMKDGQAEYLYSDTNSALDINLIGSRSKDVRYRKGDIVQIELNLANQTVWICCIDKHGRKREKRRAHNVLTGENVDYRLCLVLYNGEKFEIKNYYTRTHQEWNRKRVKRNDRRNGRATSQKK